MVEVIATDEFAQWFLDLEQADALAVDRSVGLLAQMGIALRHPHTSAIKGSRFPLRELRVKARGKPLRVFYAFDPDRQAVLLIGGDKSGDKRFYEVYIPRAEKIWEQYLAERGEVLHHDEEDLP